ncbi:response regulator [Mesoterricola silvestris]|uniref:histidine kinase n=1 Tax=Mesoterricola silvestris TaxID=2927979 RepID=A0AA48GNN3_9BACT|nr:response regulator [Mesoterricola silvestris]BDU74664.1 hypothetical protein METEAL_38380 [Mesoterricola silvestris]
MLGPDGEVRYILHQVEDVTEYILQKRLETGTAPGDFCLDPSQAEVDIVRRAHEIQEANQRLRSQQGELENRVHDRTEALAEAMEVIRKRDEQLRQTSKMEALGRLAGGIAHDFNNLLTVIYTSAEQLKFTGGESPAVDLILSASERAAGLTRQLLTFSRQQVMSLRTLDLGEVLRNSAGLLKRVLGEDIDVKLSIAPDLRPFEADPNQMDQVILNLAVNARDAMPDGGMLTLEAANADLDEGYALTHPGTRPGPYVTLAVSDNGVGMDKETQARAFEPFFTTKGLGKGTGLGLATVFGIIQQSRGYVFLYSEPGKGTTFKILLPGVPPGESGALAEPPAPDPDEPGEGTLLVVEDEDSVRSVLKTLLEEAGYEVLAARNAAEAMLCLSEGAARIDLMVTDVIMPGMNGRELSEWVAKRHPGIKVLFLSGYTNDAILRHGVLEEGLPFLQKPFSTDQLRRKVREVLGGPRG